MLGSFCTSCAFYYLPACPLTLRFTCPCLCPTAFALRLFACLSCRISLHTEAMLSVATCSMLFMAAPRWQHWLRQWRQCNSIIVRRRARSHSTSSGKQHSLHDSGHCFFMNLAFRVHCAGRIGMAGQHGQFQAHNIAKEPACCTSERELPLHSPCLRLKHSLAAQLGKCNQKHAPAHLAQCSPVRAGGVIVLARRLVHQPPLPLSQYLLRLRQAGTRCAQRLVGITASKGRRMDPLDPGPAGRRRGSLTLHAVPCVPAPLSGCTLSAPEASPLGALQHRASCVQAELVLPHAAQLGVPKQHRIPCSSAWRGVGLGVSGRCWSQTLTAR